MKQCWSNRTQSIEQWWWPEPWRDPNLRSAHLSDHVCVFLSVESPVQGRPWTPRGWFSTLPLLQLWGKPLRKAWVFPSASCCCLYPSSASVFYDVLAVFAGVFRRPDHWSQSSNGGVWQRQDHPQWQLLSLCEFTEVTTLVSRSGCDEVQYLLHIFLASHMPVMKSKCRVTEMVEWVLLEDAQVVHLFVYLRENSSESILGQPGSWRRLT